MDDSSLFKIILWDLCIFGLLRDKFCLEVNNVWEVFYNEKYKLIKYKRCKSIYNVFGYRDA